MESVNILFRPVGAHDSQTATRHPKTGKHPLVRLPVLGIYLGTFVGVGALGDLVFGAGLWLERVSTQPAQGAEKAKK